MNNKRYIRQSILAKMGESGQEKLANAHVIIVGCGGLGSIAAPYLAGAGIGELTLIDGDIPHISNLHRQVFFETAQTTDTKSEALSQHINKLNPDTKVNVINQMLTKENIQDCIVKADIVLECTDNIQCKYLVNDYCHIQQLSMVYGAIHKYDGYVSTFKNQLLSDIHLRDIFAEPNDDIPSCSEVGVLGPLAGIIGLLQANEAIKYISQCGPTLVGQMLTYSILSNDQLKLKLKKTFTKDIESIYDISTYHQDTSCNIPSIYLEEVEQNRQTYRLVSILDDSEHKAISDKIDRELFDKIDPKKWTPPDERITVFYCVSGKRSSKLVQSILTEDPTKKVISLEGGQIEYMDKSH